MKARNLIFSITYVGANRISTTAARIPAIAAIRKPRFLVRKCTTAMAAVMIRQIDGRIPNTISVQSSGP